MFFAIIFLLKGFKASAYSKGIKDGTANAIEVADRFHLLVNLREAFQKTLYRHNAVLKKIFIEYGCVNQTLTADHNKAPLVLSKPHTPNPEREMKFKKAKELALQGYGLRAIAKALNAHRRTIKKYLLSEEYPRRQAPAHHRYPLTNFFDFKEYPFRGLW